MTDHDAFFAALRARLLKGEAEYGNKSYSKSYSDLLREQAEEALDIAGWGCILWEVLQKQIERVDALEREDIVCVPRSEWERLTKDHGQGLDSYLVIRNKLEKGG